MNKSTPGGQNSETMIQHWLRRAEDPSLLDIEIKFLALWKAFSIWMKGHFGKGIPERELIEQVKKYQPLKEVFKDLMEGDLSIVAESLYNHLMRLYHKERIINSKKHYKILVRIPYPDTIELLFRMKRGYLPIGIPKPAREGDWGEPELLLKSFKILNPLLNEYFKKHGYQ